jgi:hypothetical protein
VQAIDHKSTGFKTIKVGPQKAAKLQTSDQYSTQILLCASRPLVAIEHISTGFQVHQSSSSSKTAKL